MSHEAFASAAWLLEGLTGTRAGWLHLDHGTLQLVTPDEDVFACPLSAVTDVKFPWYYFGGGVQLSAGGTPYRSSFVIPNGAEVPLARAIGGPASVLPPASKVADIQDGRRTGRRWRELFKSPPC